MNNVDEFGYPGAEGAEGQFDGGDTAAIMGTILALVATEEYTPLFLRGFLLTPTGLVRHPDSTKWWGRTDRFSRDQLIPLLCSYLSHPDRRQSEWIFRRHSRNWFLFAWNTRGNGAVDMPTKTSDFTGPEIWALWIRLSNNPWLKLLLPILDLETLIGSVLWRWYQPKTNRVTRNHMLICKMGMRHSPSITMRLANYINDWDDLISRWAAHCKATKEYPTAYLFR